MSRNKNMQKTIVMGVERKDSLRNFFSNAYRIFKDLDERFLDPSLNRREAEVRVMGGFDSGYVSQPFRIDAVAEASPFESALKMGEGYVNYTEGATYQIKEEGENFKVAIRDQEYTNILFDSKTGLMMFEVNPGAAAELREFVDVYYEGERIEYALDAFDNAVGRMIHRVDMIEFSGTEIDQKLEEYKREAVEGVKQKSEYSGPTYGSRL